MIDREFPTTLPEFQARFGDEAACFVYLCTKKWPAGSRCPRCPRTRSDTIASRHLEECTVCVHQTSLTAATMFHGTRTRFRRGSGPAAGSRRSKTPPPRIFRGSSQTFVAGVVEECSVVHTDGLKSSEALERVFKHEVDVLGKDSARAAEISPRIHRVVSLFKRVVLSTYQGSVSEKYMPAYCKEFEFRFNRRDSGSRTHLLQRVMEIAVRRRARGKRMVAAVVADSTPHAAT